VAAGAAVLVAGALVLLDRTDAFWKSPIADARVVRVTDFDGTEQAAAISRDGQYVAFLSDRDGRFDVWLTRLGTGHFYNLTRDTGRELVNRSVRMLGFSPDGTVVTFWSRQGDEPAGGGIGIWAVPLLGGPARPYLEGAAEFDWSPDGSRLVYHTPGPGDPMFVTDRGQPAGGGHLFTAPPGLHSHFPLWSADQAFVYFVQGAVPDRMDIWRIAPAGGTPERLTHHESDVSHPVVLDARTLVYLAGDGSGAGPWLHALDVERRRTHRLTSGVDRYTSLAASADGKRLVATQATTRPALWRVAIGDGAAGTRDARRVDLTTGSGFAARLGPDYLLYVVRNTAGDSVWKLQGEATTEVWSAPDARVIGAPAVEPEGRRVALSIRQGGQTRLCVMNADGTGLRVLARELALEGSPAWSPDRRSITSAAVEQGVPRLVRVPLDGGAPAPLVPEHSLDPAWSPDGRFVVFSGPDVGTRLSVKAATPDGGAHPLPALTLTRGARRLRFLPGKRALVVMRGEMRHKNLWVIDLETGAERPLTDLPPEFELRDFDLSPDGREAVLEQVQEQSDIVQLDLVR
jgi:Tol biopolymer transport system component